MDSCHFSLDVETISRLVTKQQAKQVDQLASGVIEEQLCHSATQNISVDLSKLTDKLLKLRSVDDTKYMTTSLTTEVSQ